MHEKRIANALRTTKMQLINKENILAMTAKWEGERFPDGRPRVSDDILQRMKAISIEQAWGGFSTAMTIGFSSLVIG